MAETTTNGNNRVPRPESMRRVVDRAPRELAGVRLVTPGESQREAVLQCAATGMLVGGLFYGMVGIFLSDIPGVPFVSPSLSFIFGALTAWQCYVNGLKVIRVNRRGILLFLGRPLLDRIYLNGAHHIFPLLFRLVEVPGNGEIYSVTVKPDKPVAKDNIPVHIGGIRRAQLWVRVFNPFQYFLAQDASLALESAFLDRCRKLINQASHALGMINEKAVLDDFLELDGEAYQPNHEQHVWMRRRLSDLMFDIEDQKDEAGETKTARVFEDIDAVMESAGLFRQEAELLGFEVINVVPPSIDLPEEIQAVSGEKQKQLDKNAALSRQMGTIREEAKKIKEALPGISDADALDRVNLAGGQNVTRQIFGFPGIDNAIEKGALSIAAALVGNNKKDDSGDTSGPKKP